MKARAVAVVFGTMGSGILLPCAAFDGVAVSVGDGLGDVRSVQLGVIAPQWDHKPDTSGWNLRLHWEMAVAQWQATEAATGVKTLWDASLTPVLRALPTRRPTPRPYYEFGLGFHVLSEDRIENRTLSSTYHFGSHVGIGLLLGSNHGLDLGLRYQHLSNASLETPNPGIDFVIARLGWRF